MFSRRKDTDFISDLYTICTLKIPEEVRVSSVADWLSKNIHTADAAKIRYTFKLAGREDYVDSFLIEVEDVNINDTVRSRQTGRIGKVIGLKGDNETIVVSWETGGQQLLSKGSVVKLNSATDLNSYKKVQTEADEYKSKE